jgi:hypothetical protein
MRWIALPLICVAVAGVVATAATARTDARSLIRSTTGPTPPFSTGIGDSLFQGPQAATAFAMASQAGATYARLFVSWASIAPGILPAHGFDPTDPTSPYYSWSALDSSVSAAKAAGITPILNIVSPPGWGYDTLPGTWTGGSPKIDALGAFATALATHYNGHGSAPAEHVFSVWNEPNFNRNLYPQDPTYYRSMVNAVADSVHAVNPANLVLAGELAPFKHKPSGKDKNNVIPPLSFMQKMLCVSGGSKTCNETSHFDVWTHHPYSDTGPFGHSKVSGGVELGDLPKMNSLLQSAANLGTIVTGSGQPVQFWVTEVGWSSNPPNRKSVPMSLEQRWMPECMYQMWKSGVTVGTWFLLQDMASSTPFQSGLYFRSTSLAAAQAKPLLPGFSFPLVAYLKSHGKVQIWGRDATSDGQDVSIQQRIGSGGAWKTVATITSNKYGIFQATLSLKATSKYWIRAVAPGSGNSLPFALKVPKNENLRVVPFPLSN